METINKDQHQAGFLFGAAVESIVAEMRKHLEAISGVDRIYDVNERVAAYSDATAKLNSAFARFRQSVKPFLTVYLSKAERAAAPRIPWACGLKT